MPRGVSREAFRVGGSLPLLIRARLLRRTAWRAYQAGQIRHHARPAQLRIAGPQLGVNLRADLHVSRASRQIGRRHFAPVHIDTPHIIGSVTRVDAGRRRRWLNLVRGWRRRGNRGWRCGGIGDTCADKEDDNDREASHRRSLSNRTPECAPMVNFVPRSKV